MCNPGQSHIKYRASGYGSRKGIAALYTAENASLAVLEMLVHLDKTEIPADYVLLEISVPEAAVPAFDSSSSEHLEILYQVGHHALGPDQIGYSVPSVAVPHDRAVVLYPGAVLCAIILHVQQYQIS